MKKLLHIVVSSRMMISIMLTCKEDPTLAVVYLVDFQLKIFQRSTTLFSHAQIWERRIKIENKQCKTKVDS